MVKRFCPKCGDSIPEGDINAGFFCNKCYYGENPLYNLNTEYTVAFCTNCNAYKIHSEKDTNKWIINDEKDPLMIIKKILFEEILVKQPTPEKMRYEIEFDNESMISSNQNYVICKITGSDVNHNSSKIEICKINIKKSICNNCVNLLGKRFSCVIQLRKGSKNDSDLDNILKDIVNYVNNKHLLKVEV